MKRTSLLTLALIGLISNHVVAADDFKSAVKSIEAKFEPAEAKPGQVVHLKLTIDLAEGWHTYPTVQPNKVIAASVNRFTFPPPGDLLFIQPVQNPPAEKANLDMIGEQLFYSERVSWDVPVVVLPEAAPGEKTIGIKSRILVCVQGKDENGKPKENCLPPETVPLSAKIKVLDGPAVAIDPKYQAAIAAMGAPKTDPVPPPKKETPSIPIQPTEPERSLSLLIPKDANYAAEMAAVEAMMPKLEVSNAGFVTFVLTAMFWGLVTLLTPCVFPMIPITVSFFLKQGEKKQHNPLTMAFVYTVTIILVLGLAALFFLSFFTRLAVNPWTNAGLGVLFVAFAMSLFGMFDIVLPSFLVRYTSSREGRGGYGSVIFMALSFSIVSFTCVAPFLGGFAGMVSSGNFSDLQLAAGAIAFSGTFAAPFFLLAIFPSLLKKVPRSGAWMNTIKVVMGFLELAAALKFFRTAELRWASPPTIFTYDFTLAMYVVVLVFAGMYLLNLYRLPHDEPQEHIGVTRMLIGLVCFSIAVYLTPALFHNGAERQRPRGTLYAWVDAFLLPEPSSAEVVRDGELAWSADLRRSIEDARATGQTVFIDFTGVTCTNCKLNEKNVFPEKGVTDLLKKMRLVQIYTDEIPAVFYEVPPSADGREADAEVNKKFQRKVFGSEQLPLYVLLRPQPGVKGGPVEILGVYLEGKINNVKGFEEFLQKGTAR